MLQNDMSLRREREYILILLSLFTTSLVCFISLSQVEEGKYYLEDHTAQVPLNFSQASLLTDGFVTENSVVLIEGEAVDGVLHVHNMGEPVSLSYSMAYHSQFESTILPQCGYRYSQ